MNVSRWSSYHADVLFGRPERAAVQQIDEVRQVPAEGRHRRGRGGYGRDEVGTTGSDQHGNPGRQAADIRPQRSRARLAAAARVAASPGEALAPIRQRARLRRSTRVRKSGTWIKTTLVTAAWAAVRVKTSYLRAQFLRIKARRGAKKAILAVAASMLTAAFHMLRDGTEYNDLGSDHFDRHDRSKTIRRLLRRLQDLGCDVPELAHAM